MSIFGIRKKIKQALGIQEPTPKSVQSSPIFQPVQPAPQVHTTPKKTPQTISQQTLTSSTKQELSEQDQKIAKHRTRTKVALLKKTVTLGETASLGDLHDLAEKRYFIAHKAFSDLMEEMVEENLFLYDWGTQVATITDTGKEYIQTHTKK